MRKRVTSHEAGGSNQGSVGSMKVFRFNSEGNCKSTDELNGVVMSSVLTVWRMGWKRTTLEAGTH